MASPTKPSTPAALADATACAASSRQVISAKRVSQIQGIQVYFANHGWNPGTDYPGGSIFERVGKIEKPQSWRSQSVRRSGRVAGEHQDAQERIAKGLEDEKKKAASGGWRGPVISHPSTDKKTPLSRLGQAFSFSVELRRLRLHKKPHKDWQRP
jgi:hypothetical protein